MVEDEMIPPFHLSELTGALASLEAYAGNIKKAKRLTAQSLTDPAENAIAQAAWFNRRIGQSDWTPPPARLQSSEANAWTASTKGEWDTGLSQAKQWQAEQPFSSRPANLAGYLAMTVFEDFLEAERLLLRGLKSNREDPTLYNNLAFALANLGRLEEAQNYVAMGRRLSKDKRQDTFLNATQGLIAFRSGHPEMGRKFYNLAIKTAESDEGLAWAVGIAKTYFAIEELRIRSRESPAAEKQAATAVTTLSGPFRELFLKKLRHVRETPVPPIVETRSPWIPAHQLTSCGASLVFAGRSR